MTVTSIDVSASQFPIDKQFSFGRQNFIFRFRKNAISNEYSVEIYTIDGQTFLYGNKIVYGQNIIDSIKAPFSNKIIPLNISLLQNDTGTTEINDTTFGDQIKLVTNIVED
jgi:hypothetical protein